MVSGQTQVTVELPTVQLMMFGLAVLDPVTGESSPTTVIGEGRDVVGYVTDTAYNPVGVSLTGSAYLTAPGETAGTWIADVKSDPTTGVFGIGASVLAPLLTKEGTYTVTFIFPDQAVGNVQYLGCEHNFGGSPAPGDSPKPLQTRESWLTCLLSGLLE